MMKPVTLLSPIFEKFRHDVYPNRSKLVAFLFYNILVLTTFEKWIFYSN